MGEGRRRLSYPLILSSFLPLRASIEIRHSRELFRLRKMLML
jgi:hypothetical protein